MPKNLKNKVVHPYEVCALYHIQIPLGRVVS
jgi:hypothetical protein